MPCKSHDNMYPTNLSNKNETPSNGKGPKTYVPDNKTYLKPHKAALATPENGPKEKQFLKGINESTTNWHKSIKAAKGVIASRVNQSLLNKFSETIIVDLKNNNNNNKNNNIVSCIKVNAIS